jgi:hypothetical protein
MIHASDQAMRVRVKTAVPCLFIHIDTNSSFIRDSFPECDIVLGMRGKRALDFANPFC